MVTNLLPWEFRMHFGEIGVSSCDAIFVKYLWQALLICQQFCIERQWIKSAQILGLQIRLQITLDLPYQWARLVLKYIYASIILWDTQQYLRYPEYWLQKNWSVCNICTVSEWLKNVLSQVVYSSLQCVHCVSKMSCHKM